MAILLFVIIIICYHYAKHQNKKKEVGIKNCTCYYFGYAIKIEDFDFNDIL